MESAPTCLPSTPDVPSPEEGQRHDETAHVTISVGVALTSDFPERDVDEIIHAADVALYAAKAAGRNWVRIAKVLPVEGRKENPQPETPVLTP